MPGCCRESIKTHGGHAHNIEAHSGSFSTEVKSACDVIFHFEYDFEIGPSWDDDFDLYKLFLCYFVVNTFYYEMIKDFQLEYFHSFHSSVVCMLFKCYFCGQSRSTFQDICWLEVWELKLYWHYLLRQCWIKNVFIIKITIIVLWVMKLIMRVWSWVSNYIVVNYWSSDNTTQDLYFFVKARKNMKSA